MQMRNCVRNENCHSKFLEAYPSFNLFLRKCDTSFYIHNHAFPVHIVYSQTLMLSAAGQVRQLKNIGIVSVRSKTHSKHSIDILELLYSTPQELHEPFPLTFINTNSRHGAAWSKKNSNFLIRTP